MNEADSQLSGRYLGVSKVRSGREGELSPQETKQLSAARPIPLELRADGTFVKEVTEGEFEMEGELVTFRPFRFGGKTHEEMEKAAAEMGRAFGLSFVFNEFALRRKDDSLVSPDEQTLVYMEFSKA